MGKKSQYEQIREIIADELQRRPVVHLHIQVPGADATDPEKYTNWEIKISECC